MPKKKILSLFKAFLCLPLLLGSLPHALAQEANASDEWYPFHFPAKLDPDAPINIGKLVLDAPAGKHGFVKVNGADFIFEDGTPARFWGTNLCFNANFPDKKNAELLADRIAYFGFNAVRLHHMDFYHAPKGIFEDIDPAFKDPQDKRTTTLSKRQLDRLDYLIFLFKERGIYVDINLLVARHFTEADGVKNGKQLGMAAKPASMFDPKLIELQKDYARDLLTHLNPYTKTRYVDEPAVALIEITNENSILKAWEDGSIENLPEYYTRQLDERWNVWLKHKYSTPQNVRKTWKPNKTEPFIPIPSLNTAEDMPLWELEQHQGANAIISYSSPHTAIIDRNAVTGTNWHLQYRRTGFDLKQSANYMISFLAHANTPTEIWVISQQTEAPYENLGIMQNIKLTTTPKPFLIPFTTKKDCPSAKIGFLIGTGTGQINIANIIISKTERALTPHDQQTDTFTFERTPYALTGAIPEKKQQDINEFYTDLQGSYLNGIRDFLIETLKIKVPITGIGGMNQSDVASQKNMDFMDKHAYWDHPVFPNKEFDRNDFRIHNKSIFNSPDLGIIGPLTRTGRQTPDKPFTITEWNHCYPNQYAYETPLLLAATARIEGWDALFQFSFSHGWELEPKLDSIQSYFDIIANPQQLILNALAGEVFLSNNAPTLTKYDKYYSIDSTLISVITGQINDSIINVDKINLSIKEAGVILLTKKNTSLNDKKIKRILFDIGSVKNDDDDYASNAAFKWGKGKIVLKQILKQSTNPKALVTPWEKL